MSPKTAQDLHQDALAEVPTCGPSQKRGVVCSATRRETRVIAGARCEVATTFRAGCVPGMPAQPVQAVSVRVEIGSARSGDWFAIGKSEWRADDSGAARFDAFRSYKEAYARAEHALRHSQRFKAHLARAEAAEISRSTSPASTRAASATRL